ncbi:MAG: hypothetical protein COV45_03655 [Deltaproteobacteria bacterium CG11_big_fil_rev_8_21_14_0_20_47_16]|nr:MAG: hypothetical protein COV45_03655 [Deltaproteobacteria bacterium CG11_big_fil_rev_8_21_14_0_20_47_16]
MLKQSKGGASAANIDLEADLKRLYRVVASLKTAEECAMFFEDLCTRTELAAMAERWEVVRRLSKGESYRSINQATGVSTATITRVAQWLRFGKGGYRMALARTQRVKGKTA